MEANVITDELTIGETNHLEKQTIWPKILQTCCTEGIAVGLVPIVADHLMD